MLVSDTIAAVATLGIAILLFTDNLAVWHIYIASVFISIANTLQWPAYSAAITFLVPKEHLGRAGGMTQVGDAIGSLIAPGVAGVLYVTSGLNNIILIDLVSFLFAFGTLIVVRFPQPETVTRSQRSPSGKICCLAGVSLSSEKVSSPCRSFSP